MAGDGESSECVSCLALGWGVALLAMCLVVAISEATLPNLLPRGISFRSLVMGKALFGMLLAAMVTPWAIARVLR